MVTKLQPLGRNARSFPWIARLQGFWNAIVRPQPVSREYQQWRDRLIRQRFWLVVGLAVAYLIIQGSAVYSMLRTPFPEKKGKNRQKAIHRIRCQYQLKHGMNRLMDIVHSLLTKVGGFANRNVSF
jgi:hypothetical protein